MNHITGFVLIMIPHWFRLFRFFLVLILALTTACIKSPSEPATQEPATITLSSYTVVLTSIGQRIRIDATVLDQDGKVITDATIFWRSANVSIATVGKTGLLTAVGSGATQVTVTSGDASATAAVSVEPEAGKIVITPAWSQLRSVGALVRLTAVVYDIGNSPIPGAAVVWSSSNPDVASVDANGRVTAVDAGITRITAASGAVSAFALVEVEIEIVQVAADIALNISTATLTAVGQSLKMYARVYDAEGAAISDAPVTWSSSDPAVALVSANGLESANGLVIAVSNGTTRVTAASGGVSTHATISVDIEGTGPPTNPEPEPSTDREALIAFYSATGGPDWTNNTNWLSDKPIGTWYGVTTDDEEMVAELHLERNNLNGFIPPEIEKLEYLRRLRLQYNNLTGIIPPEIGRLQHITHLVLSHNPLGTTIPPELGNLSTLEYLDLHNSRLSGFIPPEFGQLGSLQSLILSDNRIRGRIPPEIGNLAALETLLLYDNRLSGDIPAQIGNLSVLKELWLSENRLSGELPTDIGRLVALEILRMSDNQLTGGIPPEIGELNKLRSLNLSDKAAMSGPIPTELTAISSLEDLLLAGTQICAPENDLFVVWLESIELVSVDQCSTP